MTRRKEEDTKKEETSKKPVGEKLILFEAVENNPTPNYIVLGALSLAGLIRQYEEEKLVYGIEDLEPSITADELNKIIKKFIGE